MPHPKRGIDAPFLNCTSEVTQCFLYINVTLPVPCQKGGMGVEMWILVWISPTFCSQMGLGSNHIHQSKKKGGENLPLKDLVRGRVCWAKMVPFWKPRKHAFWPSPEFREPFIMLPRHTLSSIMVWNAGNGLWWQRQLRWIQIHAKFSTCKQHNRETGPCKFPYT